jgi:hypothetical protein
MDGLIVIQMNDLAMIQKKYPDKSGYFFEINQQYVLIEGVKGSSVIIIKWSVSTIRACQHP